MTILYVPDRGRWTISQAGSVFASSRHLDVLTRRWPQAKVAVES